MHFSAATPDELADELERIAAELRSGLVEAMAVSLVRGSKIAHLNVGYRPGYAPPRDDEDTEPCEYFDQCPLRDKAHGCMVYDHREGGGFAWWGLVDDAKAWALKESSIHQVEGE